MQTRIQIPETVIASWATSYIPVQKFTLYQYLQSIFTQATHVKKTFEFNFCFVFGLHNPGRKILSVYLTKALSLQFITEVTS